jgi:hypothetical protein
MPSDVFNALDSIEFGFMRERVEAEFKSMIPSNHPVLLNPRGFLQPSQLKLTH